MSDRSLQQQTIERLIVERGELIENIVAAAKMLGLSTYVDADGAIMCTEHRCPLDVCLAACQGRR